MEIDVDELLEYCRERSANAHMNADEHFKAGSKNHHWSHDWAFGRCGGMASAYSDVVDKILLMQKKEP